MMNLGRLRLEAPRTYHLLCAISLLVLFCIPPQALQAQAAGSQSLLVVGSIGPNVQSGDVGTFSMTVNNFTESVTYGIGSVMNAGNIMQGLVTAFNSDPASPVTAAFTQAGVMLTPKTPGTFLTISSSDNFVFTGVGGLAGIGFWEFLLYPP
jgi:hypothetical protein